MATLALSVQMHIHGSLGLVNGNGLLFGKYWPSHMELVLTHFGSPPNMVEKTFTTPNLLKTNRASSGINIPPPNVCDPVRFEQVQGQRLKGVIRLVT